MLILDMITKGTKPNITFRSIDIDLDSCQFLPILRKSAPIGSVFTIIVHTLDLEYLAPVDSIPMDAPNSALISASD